jgi:hypothetical protein
VARPRGHQHGNTIGNTMSKKFTSTILLFLIGVGFGIYSITSLVHAGNREDVIQACLYLIPAVAAFGALIMLPFKAES